jgi:hypothetical protein
MKLTLYQLNNMNPEVRVAPLERDWMEKTPNRFAYRCLPLNIANQHGWQILSPATFSATWDGDDRLESIRIVSEAQPHLLPISHFGSGILTFSTWSLFRTEPGWDIFVTGPLNDPKDGIAPLSGVIETDWTEATFTMNWKFTRPNRPITFEKGEPICQLFPVRRGQLEEVTPVMTPIEANPDEAAAYAAWSQSRTDFNNSLKKLGAVAQQKGWQGDYFKGEGGPEKGTMRHRTKLRLKSFKPPA